MPFAVSAVHRLLLHRAVAAQHHAAVEPPFAYPEQAGFDLSGNSIALPAPKCSVVSDTQGSYTPADARKHPKKQAPFQQAQGWRAQARQVPSRRRVPVLQQEAPAAPALGPVAHSAVMAEMEKPSADSGASKAEYLQQAASPSKSAAQALPLDSGPEFFASVSGHRRTH
jgi:hypothetical protein